ncbi:MAG: sugar ABC transporter permease [Thaumarchaeota archaeon]|nr:sugar ABC transporter permease [Nitrososphaerota archaeon]
MRDTRFALMVTIPVALFLIAWVVYPISYSFWLSLHSFKIRGGEVVPFFAGFDNYIQAVSDPDVQGAFFRTVQLDIEGIFLTTGLALGIALVLNEVIPGGSFLKVLALLPWAVSDFGTGVVWKWIWIGGFGFMNGVLIRLGLATGSTNLITVDTAIHFVAIADAWHLAPLGAFFLLASLSVIPQDLYNQAKIDGAGAFMRFRRVTLPFLTYSLLITLVIATLFISTTLDEVLTLTGGGPGDASQTLTYQIYLQTFVLFKLGYGAAISYLTLAYIIIFATIWFLLLMRRH